MRLCKFEIRNFRGLDNVVFTWDDIIILIGENNVGKSSVLKALEWFLSNKQIKDKSLFKNGLTSKDNAIELIGHFDQLTDWEKSQLAVKDKMFNDKWILRKRFWWNDDQDKWEEEYSLYYEQEYFVEWPEKTNAWDNWPDCYQPLINEIKSEFHKPTKEAVEQLKQLVREKKSQLINKVPSWVPNTSGKGNWKSNANDILPEFIKVHAIHDATSETQAKDTTVYGKIMRLILEKRLMLKDEFKDLKESLALYKPFFNLIPIILNGNKHKR